MFKKIFVALFIFTAGAVEISAQSSADIFVKSPVLCPPPEMYGNLSDIEVQKEIAAKHGIAVSLREIRVFRSCPTAAAPVTPPWNLSINDWEYCQQKNTFVSKTNPTAAPKSKQKGEVLNLKKRP
jgi:hypothetical protein